MNKIKITLFILAISILFVFKNSFVIAAPMEQQKQQNIMINSYEMFWPIVAGKVEGDSMYSLKLFKEKVREILIFSDFKKAEYNITISEKRVVEVEKLIKESRFEEAKKTLNRLSVSLDKVNKNIALAEKSGIPVEPLKERFISSLERQSALLDYLSLTLPNGQKDIFSSIKDQFEKIVSQY